MSQVEAEQAATLIESTFPDVYAHAVEPVVAMVLYLDRWTIELLRDGVAKLSEAGRDCGNMLEEFDTWLTQSDPAVADEP